MTFTCADCETKGLIAAFAMLDEEKGVMPICIKCLQDRLGIRALYEEASEKEHPKHGGNE